MRDAAGRITRWIGACADVSERRAAELDRQRETERQRFLATVGTALAAALDYETAVAELARLIVPAVADACVVDVLEPGGTIRPLVSAASPETRAVLDELRIRYPATRDRPEGVARVIRTGQPSFVPVLSDERRAELAVDDAHLRLLRALATRSNITVPLVARGEVLGALTLKRIQSDVPYGPADLAFAEELARRAALALDNARLLREARTAVHLRDEFLSSASHDLRNPLTTIQGRVQLLQRQAERDGPTDSEAAARGLEEIAAAVRKLQAMIEELQDVSSLQIGRPLTLRRRPTDLVALVAAEVEQVQETAPVHRLRLEHDLPALVADVDPARLRRVLDNLLANAIKYSPGGGDVVVTLRRDGPDADGTAWALLAVRDHGVGIPAVDLPRVFERFYRASNVAGRIAGSGIGLAGSRQILAQHGGTIAAESAEGRGSAFTVRLPLSTAGTRFARPTPTQDARSIAAAPERT
jgi:signal transduction histidine kinase